MSSAAAATGGVKIKIPLPARVEGGGGKGKGVAFAEAKKKVDASGKSVTVIKQKSTTVVPKAEVKGKTITTSTKTVTKTTVRARAEKKVYSLPGQKYDVPEEREPLRIFYESLSQQIPSSEMAEIWMMEHGLLSPERAKKAYDRKQRKNRLAKVPAPDPIKTYKQERPESSKKPQDPKSGDAKAKRFMHGDDDDDFIVKSKKAK